MARTYQIRDGVRRAKAAHLLGLETIWAEVGDSGIERKVLVSSLLSPKKQIDLRKPEQLERWLSIMNGMAEEPDLLPPIIVLPGWRGTPIADVVVVEQ